MKFIQIVWLYNVWNNCHCVSETRSIRFVQGICELVLVLNSADVA